MRTTFRLASVRYRWIKVLLAETDAGPFAIRRRIACRAVGPVAIPSGLRKSEEIGFSSASLFFKTFKTRRAVDAEKNVLVYTVVSTKLINGSPFNSISRRTD